MTIDTMSMAVSLLLSQDLHATVEYPGTICVTTKSDVFVFGTVNPQFGADVYRSWTDFQEGKDTDEAICTDVSSDCDDPVLVAETVAKTIDPEGQHSFQCAHCLCILSPGDKVVYTQNSDTSIDVFCSNACKYETQEETVEI